MKKNLLTKNKLWFNLTGEMHKFCVLGEFLKSTILKEKFFYKKHVFECKIFSKKHEFDWNSFWKKHHFELKFFLSFRQILN